VQNFAEVTANLSKNLNLIYFETCRYRSEHMKTEEIVLPVDDNDSKFDLALIHQLIDEINGSGNLKFMLEK